jgi:hypothetical protein
MSGDCWLDGDQDTAGIGVEAHVRVGVADLRIFCERGV